MAEWHQTRCSKSTVTRDIADGTFRAIVNGCVHVPVGKTAQNTVQQTAITCDVAVSLFEATLGFIRHQIEDQMASSTCTDRNRRYIAIGAVGGNGGIWHGA